MTTLSSFISNIESGTDKYYAFIGSPNTDYTPSDIKDNVLLVKKIDIGNLSKSVIRNDWKYGEVYAQFTNSEYNDGSLRNKKFYVGTFTNGEYKVFKCINNNQNSPSKISPDMINTYGVTTLADGYSWIYMYKLTSETFQKFASFSHIPLVPDIAATSKADPLIINTIQVLNQGYGYTYCVATITGDGSGATATTIIKDSKIVDIILTSVGSGYTTASISLIGDGSGASASVVVAPTGGHASNVESELFCNSVSMVCDISEKRDYQTLPHGVAYNKYGILKNIEFANNIGDMIVDYVEVTNGGSGYSTDSIPTVSITGGFDAGQVTAGTAKPATAYTTIAGNEVNHVILKYEGFNYRSTPTVTITGSGIDATAIVKMKPISIKNYTTLVVTKQKNNFKMDETIKQGATTAKVLYHDYVNGIIGVYDVNGSFVADVALEGLSSSAVAFTKPSDFISNSNLTFSNSNVFAQYDNMTVTRLESQPEKINITVLF